MSAHDLSPKCPSSILSPLVNDSKNFFHIFISCVYMFSTEEANIPHVVGFLVGLDVVGFVVGVDVVVLRRGGGVDIGCHDWSLLSKHRTEHFDHILKMSNPEVLVIKKWLLLEGFGWARVVWKMVSIHTESRSCQCG